MKFWQKVFLSVLVVFVIAFNIGMFTVMHFTYNQQLASLKQRAKSETYFLRNSISKDFANLEETTTLTREKRKNIFDSYASYYEQQNVFLELWSGTSMLRGYLGEDRKSRAELDTKDEVQNIVIDRYQDCTYLIVACNLIDPYSDNTLVVAYPLTELTATREQLVRIIIGVDIIITLLLSVSLYLIVQYLMRPLKQLSNATDEIAEGNYEQKIQVHTQDEFGKLASKFNSMSEKIENTVHLLQAESDQKQRLIDNMAHELRTPLTSISGYAEYMRMAVLSEEERIHALDYIIAEARRLEKLSRTLLMLADIREGELTTEEVNVEQLAKDMHGLFLNQLKEKNIVLQTNIGIESINANEALIQSLLSNLIENAIRACDHNGEIVVSFTESKEGYSIEVSDNGIGMEQDELEKIMEPFYRIDKARSRKQGGVGLGVTLCRQIVKLHKGTLWYESELGKGTKVHIQF